MFLLSLKLKMFYQSFSNYEIKKDKPSTKIFLKKDVSHIFGAH